MEKIKTAFIAGLVSTFIVGAMLLMNNATHQFPRLGIGRSLASILGDPDNLVVGWSVFVGLGVFVFSWMFSRFAPRIPSRSYPVKGLLFGVACWLFMMVVFMPLAGHGLFAFERGNLIAMLCLVLNCVYGVILSITYKWMLGSKLDTATVRG